MKSVYRAAGLDCSQTAYIEAHGTGTAVGDPIEAEAIATVFGSTRSTEDPVIVGSIKTNVGHTEAASGLAGVIKTVFMLEEGLIPPNINFENSHERIYLRDWNMRVRSTFNITLSQLKCLGPNFVTSMARIGHPTGFSMQLRLWRHKYSCCT